MKAKIAEHNVSTARKKAGVRYKDDADIAEYLEVIKSEDEERFFNYLRGLPTKLQAETVVELPPPFQADLVRKMEPLELAELIKALETDDATDFMQLILDVDEERGEEVFDGLTDRLQQVIRRLMVYDDEEAGAYMQTEVFTVRSNETILSTLRRLRRRKSSNESEKIRHIYVVDENKHLLRVLPLSELIFYPARKHYDDIIEEFATPYSVEAHSPIEEAVQIIEKYDLSALAVVDRKGHIIGQITHDDVVDIIQEMATEQMYGLGKVSIEEDPFESVVQTGRRRAFWLGINLVNITLVSVVIGFFEESISSIVALAVLMPIVANMAGTASIQTLTVMVRQIALGELTTSNALRFFRKELLIALVNGLVFGLAAMAISYYRYDSVMLGVAMALAMCISFVVAGLLGAGVPLMLRKFGIDPAVASSSLVVTFVDVVGFFSFLALATLILL